MKNCPKCSRKYDDSWEVCIKCNVPLIDVKARLAQLESQAKQILQEIKEIREGEVVKPQAEKQANSNIEQDQIVADAQQTSKVKNKVNYKSENVETHIGKYLLSKMGIISLVAGIAFFIAYTFQYLSPLYKIVLSYLLSVGLLVWGVRLERNSKFEKYGRSLIGGGWSLVYFITFAMHHIKAVRIINNQLVDLFLLAIVVIVMIGHLLKYRSQTAVALVLFLGYFTAGISHVTQFTLIYITVLSLIAAIISYKMQWYKLPLFSMMATYCTHFLWTRPQMGISDLSEQTFWLSMGFTIIYWLTYNVLSFVIDVAKKEHKDEIVASTFLNSFCFALLGGIALQEFNPELRFSFLLWGSIAIAAIAFLARIIKTKQYLFHPYLIAAIVYITTALYFKLDREWVSIIWLIEIPLLTFLGLYSKTKMYRVLGYILGGIMFFKMLFLLGQSKLTMLVWGQQVIVHIFTVIVGIICFYGAKLLYYRAKLCPKMQDEIGFASIYVFLGTILTGILSFKEIDKQIMSLSWGGIAFILFIIGFVSKDKYFRYAALAMMTATVIRVISIDLSKLEVIYRILAFVGLGIILLAVSFFYSKLSVSQDKDFIEKS